MVNLDPNYLRERLYRVWMKMENVPQDQIAKDMKISPFTLRAFLKGTPSRYTTTMRLKMLKWIELEEKQYGAS